MYSIKEWFSPTKEGFRHPMLCDPGTHLPQAVLLEVLFELLVLQQHRLHAVAQLAHLGLQHELVLPGAAQLLLHRLQLHLDVLSR